MVTSRDEETHANTVTVFLVTYSTVCLMLLVIFKQATGRVNLVSLITSVSLLRATWLELLQSIYVKDGRRNHQIRFGL